MRRLPTLGGKRPEQGFLDAARELMVGLGFQEVLTYTLTSEEALFRKMNVRRGRVVEVANPKVQTLTCLRSWLLPCLMDFLACNLHVEYPQRVFELGKVTVPDAKAETRSRDLETLAAATCHAGAGFSEVKSALDALFMNLGLSWTVRAMMHSSFVGGRVGKVLVGGEDVGFVGEVHPAVLESWGLENPVAAFELNMDRIVRIRNRNP